MRCRRTNAVCVGSVKMNQMFFRLWGVDEHRCNKLERVDRLAVVDMVSGFGLVNSKCTWTNRFRPKGGRRSLVIATKKKRC